MARTYRVAEFARLAGVTVRTLHHYDRLGLLTPSAVTDAGYRLYQPADLLRVQQILTLKWMGFGLSEIKQMLDSETYDLRTSLAVQKAAVDGQIARLQAASQALDRALQVADQAEAARLDAETIAAIIRGVTSHETEAWARRHYSPEAWAGIRARQLKYTPPELQEGARAWQALFAAFEQHRQDAPDSPAVQELAARMHELIEEFTGGDPAARAGLQQLHADSENVPTQHRMGDPALWSFMQRALHLYEMKQQKGRSR